MIELCFPSHELTTQLLFCYRNNALHFCLEGEALGSQHLIFGGKFTLPAATLAGQAPFHLRFRQPRMQEKCLKA